MIRHGKRIVHSLHTRITYIQILAPTEPNTSSNIHHKTKKEQCINQSGNSRDDKNDSTYDGIRSTGTKTVKTEQNTTKNQYPSTYKSNQVEQLAETKSDCAILKEFFEVDFEKYKKGCNISL